MPTLQNWNVAHAHSAGGTGRTDALSHVRSASIRKALSSNLNKRNGPFWLRHDIDVVTAMLTSVRAVIASPVVAIGWAVIVVLLLIVACLPFFLGILVVLPVLGHTTWHLYRKIVVRSHSLVQTTCSGQFPLTRYQQTKATSSAPMPIALAVLAE